eukprot:jgi/Botrbrau1/12529/Bobra.0169s0071.1
MGQPLEIVVRFASGEPDCRVVTEDTSVASLSEQVRRSAALSESVHLRFIHQGRPLGMDEVILAGPGLCQTVVHCVKADRPPTGSQKPSTHTDWLDSLDSGSALCWMAVVLLAICWAFYWLSDVRTRHSNFSLLAGFSMAVFMGVCWPAIGPVIDVFCHWWSRYMECRPCVPGEDGLYTDGARRREYIPPRPAAPIASVMGMQRPESSSMSPLYHS